MLINGKVIFVKTILALCYLLANEIRIRNRIQICAKNLRIRIQEAKKKPRIWRIQNTDSDYTYFISWFSKWVSSTSHSFFVTHNSIVSPSVDCKKSVLKIQEYFYGSANRKFYMPEFLNFKLLIPEYSPIKSIWFQSVAYFFYSDADK
jgi:hypothetical protein